MNPLDELREKTVQALGLSNDNVATMAVKMARMNWHFLIEQYEKGLPGLQPPFVVFREGPHQEADWGIGVESWYIPVEIFYFESVRRYVDTELSSDSTNSTDVELQSVQNVFVGQRLYFPDLDDYRYVESVSGNTVTVSSPVTLVSGSSAVSDVYNDVASRMKNLQKAFMPGTPFNTFQVPVIGTPSIDVSDFNPGNAVMAETNQPITCGMMELMILYGIY